MSSVWAAELVRSPGKGFGFSVIGGTDTHLPPMVCALVKDSPALKSGKVHVGDVIVKVNGVDVHLLPSKHIVEIIRKSTEKIVLTLREDKMSKLRARPFLTENVVTDPPRCGLKTRLLRSNSSGSQYSTTPTHQENFTNYRNGGATFNEYTSSRTLLKGSQSEHCNGSDGREYVSLGSKQNGQLRDPTFLLDITGKRRSPSASDIYRHCSQSGGIAAAKSNSAAEIYIDDTVAANGVQYIQRKPGSTTPLYRNTKGVAALRGGSEPPVRRTVGISSNHVDWNQPPARNYSSTAGASYSQHSTVHGPVSNYSVGGTHDARGISRTDREPGVDLRGDIPTENRHMSRSAEIEMLLRGNHVNFGNQQLSVANHVQRRLYNENVNSRSDSAITSGPSNVYTTSQDTQRVIEPFQPHLMSSRGTHSDHLRVSNSSLGTISSLGTARSEPLVKLSSHDRSLRSVPGDHVRFDSTDVTHQISGSGPATAYTTQRMALTGGHPVANSHRKHDPRYGMNVPHSRSDVPDGSMHSHFDNQAPADMSMQYMHTTKTHGTISSLPTCPDSFVYDQPSFEKITPPTHMLLKDSFSSDSSSPGISSTSFETDDSAKPVPSLRSPDIRNMEPADVASRLYTLDGVDSMDIAPLLGKNTEFSQQVCREYLQFFNFEGLSLDDALRQFLSQFPLMGETQERERILMHFSRRFYECNKPPFASEDAIHTLTCALMLLNTDLHGQSIGNKMNLSEFINNLSGLCDDKDFPKELLKTLYQSIKNKELVWAGHDKLKDKGSPRSKRKPSAPGNPFVQIKAESDALVLKEGLMYRKCVMEADGRKTPAIRRGWKLYYGVLKGLVLFLYKPEQVSPEQAVTIGIHHALAGYAAEYKKRPFVYKIITADWRVFMFQARSKQDAQEWVDALNLSSSALSSPPLPAPVSSSKRFQRPVMPVSVTALKLPDQLKHHQAKVQEVENDMKDHREQHPGDTAKEIREWESKIDYLEFEHKRFLTYVSVLTSTRLKDKLQLLLSRTNKIKMDGIQRSNSLGDIATHSKSSPKSERKNSKLRESYLMAVSN